MQLVQPPSCLKRFTEEAWKRCPQRAKALMSEGSPAHFLPTSRFQILPLPGTELRKVVGLTPVESTRGSFLRLCLYHSVNNMIFHLKITRLKLFAIFIYVILRRSFTYRHSYGNSVQEVKIVKRPSLPRVSFSSKIRRL